MPAPLGGRAYFQYDSDNSKSYAYNARAANAIACNNTVVARGALPSMPRLLKGRGVWIQGQTSGLRRFVLIGDPASATYLAGGVLSVPIDGENWIVTGREGEKDRGSTKD